MKALDRQSPSLYSGPEVLYSVRQGQGVSLTRDPLCWVPKQAGCLFYWPRKDERLMESRLVGCRTLDLQRGRQKLWPLLHGSSLLGTEEAFSTVWCFPWLSSILSYNWLPIYRSSLKNWDILFHWNFLKLGFEMGSTFHKYTSSFTSLNVEVVL